MNEMKPTLKRAIELLRKNELGDTLDMIGQVMEQEGCMELKDHLQMLSEDYDRMLQFMRQGFSDEQRPLLYARLLQRVWQLIQDVELAWRNKNRNLYIDAVRRQTAHPASRELLRGVLEGYVADLAMIMLMPKDERLQRRRQLEERHVAFMSSLFAKLWTSPQWTADDLQFYTSLVLSPTIEPRDAQLIVSAISIAAINLFDIRKFTFLVEIYQQATNVSLKQRALVGWTFALPQNVGTFFPELKRTVNRLLSDEDIRRELLELQIQVYWCLNAERDASEIQREIIPVFIKNNNLDITRFGITEKEDDELEDILHPDAEEQRMEEMENSINKMRKMQEQGADVFFGGFSQMKRFPFFNDMANWLMPYYSDHPGLTSSLATSEQRQLYRTFSAYPAFCDSDKYSMVLALTQIYERIPESYKEMILSEQMADDMAPSEEERTSPAFLRRLYLQDLYRFYMLFPKRDDVVNCFVMRKNDSDERTHLPSQFFFSSLLCEPMMDEEKLKLGKFLAKRGHWNNLERTLNSFYMERDLRPADYFILEAHLALHKNQYRTANKSYQIALQMVSENIAAINGWARTSMLSHYYEDALTAYRLLMEKHPDNKRYQLNECIAMLKLQRIDEAMEKLFRLSYEYPDDDNVKRILTWGLMCQGKLEQAEAEYNSLLENAQTLDYLNAGYCQWFMGKIEKAVDLFATYVRILNRQDDRGVAFDMLESSLDDDKAFIISHGVTETEIRLMVDLVKKAL